MHMNSNIGILCTYITRVHEGRCVCVCARVAVIRMYIIYAQCDLVI